MTSQTWDERYRSAGLVERAEEVLRPVDVDGVETTAIDALVLARRP